MGKVKSSKKKKSYSDKYEKKSEVIKKEDRNFSKEEEDIKKYEKHMHKQEKHMSKYEKIPEGTIRKGNAYIGMVVCLVLGLYLGALIPDMMVKDDPHAGHNHGPETSVQSSTIEQSLKSPNENLQSGQISNNSNIPQNLIKDIENTKKDLEKSPNNAKLLAKLGNLYFDSNQVKLAIDAYEKSLQIAPSNADVLTDLGIMYREDKSFDKALECFKKAQTINFKHENALFNEAIVLYYDLHRTAEAVSVWKKLLEINPKATTPDGVAISEVIKKLQ